ncbi:hypothetical protein Q1695_004798 [Nippostrongylus brasiliensis]|nr:hypothetical protein Q1695_004798 [Nippostrongylus brasiliensis]
MAFETLNTQDWKRIVDRLISVWSGYQLGVDFRSGGPETAAKDEWFREVVAEYIFTSSCLKADELEDWLNNVLYTEFNLILDDDSVYLTSIFLVEAIGYLKHNDRMRLEQLLKTLPSDEVILQVKKNSQAEFDEDDGVAEMDVISESSEDETGMQSGNPGKQRTPRTVTDEDGWTTILKN